VARGTYLTVNGCQARAHGERSETRTIERRKWEKRVQPDLTGVNDTMAQPSINRARVDKNAGYLPRQQFITSLDVIALLNYNCTFFLVGHVVYRITWNHQKFLYHLKC